MEAYKPNYRRVTSADQLDYSKNIDQKSGQGLVSIITVDCNEFVPRSIVGILMGANATYEAMQLTLTTGIATYFSRSRQKLWVKGDESGNKQLIRNVYADCDQDFIIYDVEPLGPACHTGQMSCFEEDI